MDIFSDTHFAFLTFRAHCSEPQVFEDFIAIFLPLISLKSDTYRWTIEKDNTPDKHIHIFFSHNKKDKSKIEQMIMSKSIKQFKSSLNQTNWKYAFDLKLVANTLDDKLKTLGYVSKDINLRNDTKNISQDIMTKSCDFYFTHRRIENATDNDIKIITSKNFHIKCEQYAKDNNMSVTDYHLIARMTFDRHSFQISNKDQEKYLAELKFMNAPEYNQNCLEWAIINRFQKETEEHELLNYIKYLVRLIKKAGVTYETYHSSYWSV